MLTLFLFTIFEISKIIMDEKKIIFETSIELSQKIIKPGTYNMRGKFLVNKKELGNISRLSRIYFPCNKKSCTYPFKIEMEIEKLKIEDLINFINRKNLESSFIFREINQKEELKIDIPFKYLIDSNLNLDLNLIKIEETKIIIKEKPSIAFNLNITNPFDFKIKILKAKIFFFIENQKLEKDFQINEEIEKGQKSFLLDYQIKGDLLFYLLSKKFREEDISTSLSAKYNGFIKIAIKDYFFEIPFEK